MVCQDCNNKIKYLELSIQGLCWDCHRKKQNLLKQDRQLKKAERFFNTEDIEKTQGKDNYLESY